MNAETNELKRRLEQATLATPSDPGPLDEETAMLRESWLALGKLLQAEYHLKQPGRITGPIEVVELRPAMVGSRKTGWMALSCVASAMVAVGLWLVFQSTHSRDTVEQVHQPVAGSGISRSDAPGTVAISAIELAWEDDWDTEFAQTAFVLQQIHGERAQDSSLSRLQGEFQQIARDFESGAL